MGIGDFFAKINNYLQDKYQGMSDFLSNKGIPLNKYNEFLESHGMPAMWSTIAILLLIIVIIVLITMLAFKSSIVLHVSFEDQGRNVLNSVYLTLTSNDSTIYSQVISSGDIELSGVSKGDLIRVNAVLAGYTLLNPTEISVMDNEQTVVFVLSKDVLSGNIQLRLVDKTERTTVRNADVNVILADGQVLSGKTDESGSISFSGIPIGQLLTIKVLKDGYIETETTLVANDGIMSIDLEPSDLVCNEKGTITFNVSAVSQPIADAKIIVYTNSTNKIAEELTDPEGKAPILVPKCQALRYVVSKEGFVNYDSQDKNNNYTLRANTDTLNVYFQIGGSEIKVFAKDESGSTMSGVTVALYSENGLIIDTNVTDTWGQVVFSGVDIKRGAYVSAYAQGNFYPVSKYINPDVPGPYDLVLKKIDSSKAAKVQLFTADSDNKPISNATIEMYYLTDNGELPIYMPDNKTSITGFYMAILEPEYNLKINATTESLFGSETQQLVTGDNKFEITMTPNEKVNTLYVYGVTGNALKDSKITISTEQSTLYDGNTGSGIVKFVAGSAKEVNVNVVDNEGNAYAKLLPVSDKMELLLSPLDISKDPKISFVGIYDATGNKVNGVKKGATYYFNFSVIWPKNQTIGEAHIRLGEDNIPAISMPYSILAVDAKNTRKEYGLYFTDDESNPKDLQVMGRQGIKNKWVNVIYTNPKGLSEFRVKVKVEDILDLNKLTMYYRASSSDGKEYFTDPKVSMLVVDTRLQRLHSLANKEEINVFSSLFECSSLAGVCYSYKFVDGYLNYPEFSAVKDEVYAIDLEFFSQSDLQVPLDFNVNSMLNTITLNGTDYDLINFNPKAVESQSLRETIALKQNQTTKLRLYFTAKQVGNGSINMSSSLFGLSKNFDFRIDGQKNMTVNINSNMIEFGKPVTFGITDAFGKITNAIINIADSESTTSVFLQGNGTLDKGQDGRYVINPLPSGVYNYEVRAQGHVTFRGNFIVTRFGVLSTPKQEYEIRIPLGKTQRTYEIEFANISDYPVTKLNYKVLRDDAKAFVANYRFLRSNLLPKTANKLIVDVSTDTTQQVYGDQDLAIEGTINNNEVVRSVLHIIFVSNTDSDSNCLLVNPNEISLSLYDTQKDKSVGNLTLTNNCESDFQTLNPEIIYRDLDTLQQAGQALQFSATAISLKRGETKTLRYTFNSSLNVSNSVSIEAFLNIDTGYFKKQIPVHAKIIHSLGALYISVSNPQLFLSSNQIVTMPLFVQNLGTVAMRNVTVAVQPYNSTNYAGLVPYSNLPQSSYYNPLLNGPQVRSLYDAQGQYQDTLNPYMSGQYSAQGLYNASQTYVQATVVPNPRTLQYVLPNQTSMVQLLIKPPYTQKSNAISAFTIRVQGYTITDNKQVVAVTPVMINVSSPKCLVVNVPSVKGVYFTTNQLGVTLENKSASITNQCAEPVILEMPMTKSFGSATELEIDLENKTILPMQTEKVNSYLYTGDELDTSEPIVFKAKGANTNADYGFTLYYNLKIGKDAFGKENNPLEGKNRKICGTNDSIQVSYPKVGQDCGSSYCDGQMASDFLQSKITQYVKNFETNSAKYIKSLGAASCGNSQSCSFEKIGIENTPFVMHLMHDKLSEAYLNSILSQSVNGIKSIDFIPAGDFDIEAQSVNQFNKLFIDSSISKCGKYVIQLSGAFNIENGMMMKDSYNILAKATYESTSECESEIQNAALFLPKDSKSDKSNTFGFTHAYVDYDHSVSGFSDLAVQLSKTMFGQERVEAGKPNTLYLRQGTLGHFMDLEIDNDKVTVTLDNAVDVSKKDEIIRNIQAFLSGNYDGCTDVDKKKAQFFGATEPKEGQFKLNVKDKELGLCFGPQSIPFSITATGPGSVSLYTSPTNPQGYTAQIKDSDGKPVSDVTFVEKEEKKFVLDVDITNAQLAGTSGKIASEKLKIIMKPTGGSEKSETINFVEKGVLPEEFVAKVLDSDLASKDHYALINWNGTTNSKTGCEVVDEVRAKNPNLFIEASTRSGKCPTNNLKPIMNTIDNGFWSSTGVAAVAGMTACIGSEWAIGKTKYLGPFGPLSATIGCTIMVGDLVVSSMYAKHRANIAVGNSKWNGWDTVHDGANNWGLGWLLNNYDLNGAKSTDKDAAMEAYQRDWTSWTNDDTETAVIGTVSRYQTVKMVLSAADKETVLSFYDELAKAGAKYGSIITDPKILSDPAKYFGEIETRELLSLGPKNNFSQAYNKFYKLAGKNGGVNKFFESSMADMSNTAFKDMTQAAKDQIAKQTEIESKLAPGKTIADVPAEITALETDIRAKTSALKTAGHDVRNLDQAIKDASDQLATMKRASAAKTKLQNELSELKKLKINNADLTELKTLKSELDAIKLDPAKVTSTVETKGAWNTTKRAFNGRIASALKGIFKGVVSSALAIEAYNGAWGTMMGKVFDNANKKIINLTVPDNFVRQTTYNLAVTRQGESIYSGVISEANPKDAFGFCKPENLSRGFILGNSPTGLGSAINASSDCTQYSSLFNKYGEVLSKNTNGFLTAKNMVAQVQVESRFKIISSSTSGSIGLGQFTMGTFCGYTRLITTSKYRGYLEQFNMDELKKYGVSSFEELYSKTCKPGDKYIPQCKGGLFYYLEDCTKEQMNQELDPRFNPEISMMFMAMHLQDNYSSKGAHLRSVVESYVVGPGCILGDGKYAEPGSKNCPINPKTGKSNFDLNPRIKTGEYFQDYTNALNSADNCLSGKSTTNIVNTNAKLSCTKDTKIALVGDSITQGYSQNLKGLLTSCPNVTTIAEQSASTSKIFSNLKNDSGRYDVIIIMAGINDISNGVKIPEIEKNLSGIYALAGTKLIGKDTEKLYALSIAPYEKYSKEIQTINDWIKDKAPNANYIDVSSNIDSKELHSTNNYEKIAQTVYNKVFAS